MNDWKEAAWIALSLLVASAFIYFGVNGMNVGREYVSRVNAEDDATERIKEFRMYNAYNNKTVYCQDIVSLIMQTQGNPYVVVKEGSNTFYWQSSEAVANTESIPIQKASNYTSAEVLDKLNIDKVYTAQLIYGSNNEVIGISLTTS